jgi:hypothetical protein
MKNLIVFIIKTITLQQYHTLNHTHLIIAMYHYVTYTNNTVITYTVNPISKKQLTSI